LGLTPSEIEVLIDLVEADSVTPCSTRARKKVKEKHGFSSTVVVNNYIKSLKNKGVIIQTTDGYRFMPLVIPPKSNVLEITWTG
jgi:hypothetical protein